MMPNPDDFDDALRRADPLSGAMLETLSIETALDELGRQLVNVPVPTTRSWTRTKKKRWFTRPVIGAGVATLVVVGVAGASTLLTALTGQNQPAIYIHAGGPGEILRTWAPDYCKVALAISSNIKYPSGYENWRLNVLVFEDGIPNPSVTGACPVPPPGGTPKVNQVEVSTGALRGWFAMGAFCAWVKDFTVAKESGNTTGASTASLEVAGATAWPAVRDEDPHPGTNTVFGFFLPFQRAVAAGDATQAAMMLTDSNDGCQGFVPAPLVHGASAAGNQAN